VLAGLRCTVISIGVEHGVDEARARIDDAGALPWPAVLRPSIATDRRRVFLSIADRGQLCEFRATVPALQRADQRLLALMAGVVQTGGLGRVFENAEELLEAPVGRDLLVAVMDLWDAIQATEATLHGLLHMVGVAARNGNRLGAEHHTNAAHLRRALGADAYARLELPVMTLYAGNRDKPQGWWKWLLGVSGWVGVLLGGGASGSRGSQVDRVAAHFGVVPDAAGVA
jgi:hypothetical protein